MIPKLIINTITAWNEPHRARHQFTYAMAKKIPVIFVSRNKTGWWKLSISQPFENITLIEPCFPVDYRLRYRLPIINEIYQLWLLPKLRKIFGEVYVVNFDFTSSLVKRYFPNVVYYCNDEYIGNSRYNISFINAYIGRSERKIAATAVFCIATSRYLVNKLKAFNPSTYEIPLGVDVSNTPPDNPSVKKNKQKIVVGQVGFIDDRKVPIEAINLISEFENIELVLIGPVDSSFLRKMKHPEKIKMTGILKGDKLTNELNDIDVGIALYNLKEINKGTTPNKLWHYLSLGKPVVVSNLPNIQGMEFPDKSVYILRDEKEVNELIMLAAAEDTEELKRSRIEFAKKNTWNQRVETFMKYFDKHFPGNNLIIS